MKQPFLIGIFSIVTIFLLTLQFRNDSPVLHAASEAAPTFYDVVPAIGRPGTLFAFYATGFNQEEKVVYWFNLPDGNVQGDTCAYVVDSSHNGRADWQWRAPYDALPGAWSVVAYGVESGVQHVLPFDIYNPGVQHAGDVLIDAERAVYNPPDVAVEPSAGAPETRFYFFATGFQPGEKVHFWATDPRYDEFGSDSGYTVYANPDGRADWHWKAPDDAVQGLWSMVAWGAESTVERVIFFTVGAEYEMQPGDG